MNLTLNFNINLFSKIIEKVTMRSSDITLESLPGSAPEIPNATLPFTNPTPILQQTKSIITTNPLIIEKQEDIANPTFKDINKGVSITFIGLLDDMFNKPDDIDWFTYLKEILKKDKRYNYLTVLLFLIALYILLVK